MAKHYRASGKKQYTKYSVCTMVGNSFEHKDFDNKDDAERYAKRASKLKGSSSIHECIIEDDGKLKHEIKADLTAMYICGCKQD
jgi:hypothetical protein